MPPTTALLLAAALVVGASASPQWKAEPSTSTVGWWDGAWWGGPGAEPSPTSAQAWPRVATATGAPMQHVAMFSIDGLHGSDVEKYVAVRPRSNMSLLLASALEYTDAYTSAPSDSFPGTVALVAGGTPKTTGIWYDDTWDSSYWAPGSNCSGPGGAEVLYDESIDYDSSLVFSGGIDPAKLPRTLVKGVCTPVYPHARLRVNTIFEVARAAGMVTAYADKHPAYDLVRGPSGTGLTVGYFPEQAADGFADNVGVQSVANTIAYDSYHTAAFLDWLDGTTPAHSEGNLSSIPALMGGNFQSFSVAEKQVGYNNDSALSLSGPQLEALDFIDAFFGQYIAKLKAKGIYEDTLIVVASKHGQAPINESLWHTVDPAALVNATGVDLAFVTTDDIALIWLSHTSDLSTATSNLARAASSLSIQAIYSGANLTAAGFGNPATDPRVPDIIVQPVQGTCYTTSRKKIAEHGGLSEDDRHVACFASSPRFAPAGRRQVSARVETRQLAPTVLTALGLDPWKLQAVLAEGTEVLPGF